MVKAVDVGIIEAGRALRIVWDDGESDRFHAVWLRDNALDAKTRSPTNGQRLITVLDIAEELVIAAATIDGRGDLTLVFRPDGDETIFPAAWLRAHSYDRASPRERGWIGPEIDLWDHTLQACAPAGAYPRLRQDRRALADWLEAVRRYGFAILSEASTQSGSLAEIVGLFGYIRETNYGRWFDVRAEVNPSNLAYTNLGLQAHTDNPYRDPVPTLQVLHCLENSVEGGDSIVVDGFRAARRLREENPPGFDLLSRYPARFEYARAAGVRLSAKRPFIELGPDGELIAIRFNNRSAAPIVDVPYAKMEAFYAAYQKFAAILEDPNMAVTFKLQPGEAFIVDNTRVLHARKAFSSAGKRWLQGCYADKDGLLSTLAAIEAEIAREAAE
jgi:[2-(trimethylamino)ethyl]phosphonate dioxygenase